MSKQKQSEAVYAAIVSVLNEAGVDFEDVQVIHEELNEERRAQVTSILFEGFKSGSISLKKEYDSDAKLRTYCSGLISNWLRKDRRLNGGQKYQPKNPGSRVGSTDPALRAMRLLLKTQSDPSKRADIQRHIDKRVAEIKNARSASSVGQVNADALPEELKHLAG